MRLVSFIAFLCVLCASVVGASPEVRNPQSEIRNRKAEFLVKCADWWKAGKYPLEVPHPTKGWDGSDPCWAGAVSAMILKRSDEEVREANRYFERMPVDLAEDDGTRALQVVFVYNRFRKDPKLSPAAVSHLEEAVKRAGETPAVQTASVWDYEKTESREFMRLVSRLLSAQIGAYSDANAATTRLSLFLDEHARKGWEEFYSPFAAEKVIGGLIMVRQWAEHPFLRRKAEMMLDLLTAEHAALNLDGVLCGPSARTPGFEPTLDDPSQNSRRDGASDGTYPISYVLFGTGAPDFRGSLGPIILAAGDYEPPRVILDLAESEARGSFEFKSRKPGSSRHISIISNAGEPTDDAFNARIYAWVTSDFILGSSQEVQGRYGMSRQDMLPVSLNVRGSTKAIVFPEVGRKCDIFQHKNVVIGKGIEGRAYIAHREFEEKVEKDGWILLKSPAAFVAFKAVGGYKWEAIESPLVYGDYITFEEKDAPFVLEVARSSDYKGDFERFQSDIIDNKLEVGKDPLGEPFVHYESCSGGDSGPSAEAFSIELRPENLPKLNGGPVPLHRYPALECPHIHSDWDTGVVRVDFKDRHLLLDFADSLRPLKREWGG